MNKLGIAGRRYLILWASTESSSTLAWIQGFNGGHQNGYYIKTYSYWARAVRKVRK